MKPLALSLLALATVSVAFPQGTEALREFKAEKIPSAPRSAGIYHLETGTWTRTRSAAANFGPDVIFSNTAMSGYYSSLAAAGGFAAGGTTWEEGLIPTMENPNYPAADRSSYRVNCLTIGYCDFNPPQTSGWELTFYNSYIPCTINTNPDATVAVTGLPADGCWIVTLELGGSQQFCLVGDGGDGFQGNQDEDSFGWGSKYIGSDGSALAGFYLAGDPQFTDPGWAQGDTPSAGTNTYYGPSSLCTIASGESVSTGNGTEDFSRFTDFGSPANSYCHFFGGYSNNVGCGGPSNPYASRFMEISAALEECPPPQISTPYCQSNPSTNGVQSTVSIFGSTSVVADEVEVTAYLPQNTVGFFLTSLDTGFVPNAGGSNGNLCLGGAIGRFQQLAAISGADGEITISTLTGQWSVTNIPHPMTPYSAMPGTTSHFQLWFRENTSFPSSNFSQGVRVTWTP